MKMKKEETVDEDALESFRSLLTAEKRTADADQSDDEINPRAHRQLLSAIERIDRTQHIKAPTRTEVSGKESEFHVVKSKGVVDRNEKLTFHQLKNVPRKTSENVARDLKKLSRSKKRLAKPLEKPVAERIARGIAYEKARVQLDRWEAVVQKNRFDDCLVFPQKSADEVTIHDASQEKTSSYRIKSDLMLELEALEARRPGKVAEVVKLVEEQNLSKKELVAQQKEMARLRRKESYEIEKARRQNKIKSKKYHKVLKKDRIKKQLAEFEKLQKSDPEEALRRLELIERNRVAERSHLRHRNTGAWAKSLQVRAKYDKDARKDLSEQLAIGRELKQQKQFEESEDTDQETSEKEVEKDEDYDPFDPWKAKKETSEEDSVNYRKYWTVRNDNEQKRKEFEAMEVTDKGLSWTVEDIQEGEVQLSTVCLPPERKKSGRKLAKFKKRSIDEMFDSAEQKMTQKVAKKLKNLQKKTVKSNRTVKKSAKNRDHLNLGLKKTAQRPEIDEALSESTRKETEDTEIFANLSKIISSSAEKDKEIEPDNFATVKPKILRTALPDGVFHGEEEDEIGNGKLSLMEAIEDEDIFTDFSREKSDQIATDQPQDIDMTLPGWGSWTGQGVKKPQKRMMLKFPKNLPRKDSKKDSVIINEIVSDRTKQHLVRDLPFPFTSVKDFEASIRAPVGRTFVPETAHRVLTKPSVMTKMGTIIEPMDEKFLMEGQKPQRVKSKTDRRIEKIPEMPKIE